MPCCAKSIASCGRPPAAVNKTPASSRASADLDDFFERDDATTTLSAEAAGDGGYEGVIFDEDEADEEDEKDDEDSEDDADVYF